MPGTEWTCSKHLCINEDICTYLDLTSYCLMASSRARERLPADILPRSPCCYSIRQTVLAQQASPAMCAPKAVLFLSGLWPDYISWPLLWAVWPCDSVLAKRRWAEVMGTTSRHIPRGTSSPSPGPVGGEDRKDPQKGRASRWKKPGSLNDGVEAHISKNICTRK